MAVRLSVDISHEKVEDGTLAYPKAVDGDRQLLATRASQPSFPRSTPEPGHPLQIDQLDAL